MKARASGRRSPTPKLEPSPIDPLVAQALAWRAAEAASGTGRRLRQRVGRTFFGREYAFVARASLADEAGLFPVRGRLWKLDDFTHLLSLSGNNRRESGDIRNANIVPRAELNQHLFPASADPAGTASTGPTIDDNHCRSVSIHLAARSTPGTVRRCGRNAFAGILAVRQWRCRH